MWDAIAFGALIKAKRGQRGLTQAQLAEQLLGSADRKGEVSQVENGKITPQEDTIQKYLDLFEISEAEMAPIRMARPAAEQLGDIPALSREALQNLAARFGLGDPYDAPDGELRRLLTMKADEYRGLKAEVDQIDEGLKRLSNLKAAAQDAIARVDLDEVEELLGRVQEVELEEAAKTAELRAQNALLRGNVEQAYRLLVAAADSFAAVDEVEPCRRRNSYRETLYRHGLRFGGDGLQKAVDMIRPALATLEDCEESWLWASCTQNLGLVLEEQGRRTQGEAGTILLRTAEEAYRAALRIRTEDAYPMDWAATMQNLANVLEEQGRRTQGEAGAALLAQAVEAHRAALRFRTEAAHPADWALTTQNLGLALTEQSTRTEGEARTKLLAEAVEAFRAALRIRTEDALPEEWAATMANLGIALKAQGSDTPSAAGERLIVKALKAYRAALRVYTEEIHPVHWAMTHANMAESEEALGKHEATSDRKRHFEAALDHIASALRVFDPESTAFYYDYTIEVRDRIQAALDALDRGIA